MGDGRHMTHLVSSLPPPIKKKGGKKRGRVGRGHLFTRSLKFILTMLKPLKKKKRKKKGDTGKKQKASTWAQTVLPPLSLDSPKKGKKKRKKRWGWGNFPPATRRPFLPRLTPPSQKRKKRGEKKKE